MPLKQAAEEGDILVAHSLADFLHRPVVVFEQAFGGRDAQLLQIRQRAVSGCLLEASNKIT